MKTGITTNFRGLRALVIHPDDVNRSRLVGILGRLGLSTMSFAPDALPPGALPECDLVLFDADQDADPPWSLGDVNDIPLIALIGNEVPSRLSRVVRHRCDSHILKPILSNGVYTALVLAVNGHQRRLRSDREMDALRGRQAGRRIVTQAVLHMMSTCGVDENVAYRRLRAEAMDRRIPVEEMARIRLGLSGTEEPPKTRMTGRPRKA